VAKISFSVDLKHQIELNPIMHLLLLLQVLTIIRKSNRSIYNTIIKSKAIIVTGRGGLQGCVMSRIPNSLDNRLTDDCQPYAPEGLYSAFSG
jgi:hypothetical protein